MKQFDLQEYLKNPDREIVTRDGRAARILCTDRNYDNYPVVALIQEHRYEDTCNYTKDGLFLDGTEDRNDLFFAPEKKEGWVNIYRTGSGTQVGEIYNSKEDAETLAKDCESYVATYVTTIKIEWKE